MITSKEYYGNPGAYTISDFALFSVTILLVERAGLGYNVSFFSPTAGTRTVQYRASRGVLQWATTEPFYDPGVPDVSQLERITVIFKS